jgi:hypothetical protein
MDSQEGFNRSFEMCSEQALFERETIRSDDDWSFAGEVGVATAPAAPLVEATPELDPDQAAELPWSRGPVADGRRRAADDDDEFEDDFDDDEEDDFDDDLDDDFDDDDFDDDDEEDDDFDDDFDEDDL